MTVRTGEAEVLQRISAWAKSDQRIRAVLLYSSRTNPARNPDQFSDFDILLIVEDVRSFFDDDSWLEAYGEVLAVYRNPFGEQFGFEHFGFITTYVDGTKIDYGFYPVAFLSWAASLTRLFEDLDDGYRVLVDKDGLAAKLPPPSFQSYLLQKPSEKEFRDTIDECFNDALYVARNIRRDNLFMVKLCLDYTMKYLCLRKVLEWRVAQAQGWMVRLGEHGKGLNKWVEPEIWAELKSTYTGAGSEENWHALHQTLDLFCRLARELAADLGYTYPSRQEKLIREEIRNITEI
jgi:aminoglycoside 6-adenylyltransferase